MKFSRVSSEPSEYGAGGFVSAICSFLYTKAYIEGTDSSICNHRHHGRGERNFDHASRVKW